MRCCHTQRNALKCSMIITLIISLIILIPGVLAFFFFDVLVDFYLNNVIKDLNITKELISHHESIVSSKDELPEEIDLGRAPLLLAWFLVGLGGNLAMFSMFGILASISSKPDFTILLVLLMLAGLVGQFVLFACILDLNCYANSVVMDVLETALKTRYEFGAGTNSSFTFLMNSVMLLGQCCGVKGPTDFLRMGSSNFTYELDDQMYTIPTILPPACCKRSFIENGFQATLTCIKSKDIDNINNKGCYEEIYTYINNNYGRFVMWSFTFTVLWEVVQILLGLIILCSPSTVERDALNQVLQAGQLEDLNDYGLPNSSDVSTATKESTTSASWKDVFVPFASVPSLETVPNTSTQIW